MCAAWAHIAPDGRGEPQLAGRRLLVEHPRPRAPHAHRDHAVLLVRCVWGYHDECGEHDMKFKYRRELDGDIKYTCSPR